MLADPRRAEPVRITRLDPACAPAAELADYARLEVAARAADEPDESDEPALTVDWALARLTRPPSEGRSRLHWVRAVGQHR